MSYWYVATPFTKFPYGEEAAYRVAAAQTALLLRAGVPAFSPIVHGEALTKHGGIPSVDDDLWKAINQPLMDAAKGIIVVTAEGWEESRGVSAEIVMFVEANKPLVYMTPGVIPDGLRG